MRALMLAAVLAGTLVGALSSSRADDAPATEGYYEGHITMYPYTPVYCDRDSGIGSPCYGSSGFEVPKSAPLPPNEKWCAWVDLTEVMKSPGLMDKWYKWAPRVV